MAFEDIKDPIVRQYLQQQADAKAAEQAAQKRNKDFQLTATIGDAVGSLASGRDQNQAYFNRWENMGAAPKMTNVEGIKVSMDPIRQAGERGVKDAKENASRATQDFMTEQKVVDMGRQRQTEDQAAQAARDKADPNSAVSVAARQMLKMVAPNTPDDQIANLSAAQLEKISPDLVKATEARINREFQASQTQANQAFQAGQNALNRNQQRELAALNAGVRQQERTEKMQEKKAANQEKADEFQYRYNTLTKNTQKLKDLVNKYGTFEAFGPQSGQMDSLLYQIATDYAKLVDPTSVAREGEVAAAQKYMLPIKGLTTRNSTALKLIDNYMQDLDNRIGSRNAAKPGQSGGKSGPYGDTVVQDGITYTWNGSEYVER